MDQHYTKSPFFYQLLLYPHNRFLCMHVRVKVLRYLLWKPSYSRAIVEQGIKSSWSAGVCVCVAACNYTGNQIYVHNPVLTEKYITITCNDLEWDHACQETWSTNNLMHLCLPPAVGDSLACKRVPRYTHAATGKTRMQRSCNVFAMSHLWVSNSEGIKLGAHLMYIVLKRIVQYSNIWLWQYPSNVAARIRISV